MPDTAWTKEPPTSSGVYWWRADERDYEPEIHEIADGLVFRIESRQSEPVANHGGEWLGPISPEDFQQLVRLREAAGKALSMIRQLAGTLDARTQRGMAQDAEYITNEIRAALETKP